MSLTAQVFACLGCWIAGPLTFVWLWHRARRGQGR